MELTIEEEIRQALRLLESLLQAAGVSEGELERRLDVSPGYVVRLLAGEIELKLRHILSILRVVEIEPSLFFESLYPAGAAGASGGTIRMDALQQRLEGLGLGEPSAARLQVETRDLERRVQSVAEKRRWPAGG